jgi:hypothetical protein
MATGGVETIHMLLGTVEGIKWSGGNKKFCKKIGVKFTAKEVICIN